MKPGIALDLFKSLAASLPTAVTVVTALDGRRPVGLTTGAVCGLSGEPPLMLACIGHRSRTLPAIVRSGAFCVNILDSGSSWLSDRFAGSADEKFAGVAWKPAENGAPILTEGAVAHAVCETAFTADGGDHLIVVGLVVGGDSGAGEPLLYHRRAYAGLDRNR